MTVRGYLLMKMGWGTTGCGEGWNEVLNMETVRFMQSRLSIHSRY